MFVRVKTTPNSPRRSVQVVESVRWADAVRQRIVRHMGIANDADEEAKLRVMADEFIARELAARFNQDSLFSVDAASVARRPGRPARQTLSSVACVDEVQLGDLREVARRDRKSVV